ncbi:MAG: fumarylacetoacetate hydrolase family protein [Burkholderiaceae bacterium]|nr:fumarylacetoacetate hydrolase family protein [Burkholderiaceae bacterium]
MKLASYFTSCGASFGAVEGGGIVDLRARLGRAYPDLKSLLVGDGLDAAQRVLRGAVADFRLDEVVYLPVVPNPGKIVCAGLNYEEHRLEGNRPKTADPALFLRLPQSQTGHLRPLVRPAESVQFDYEGEIALVVGRRGRRIPEARAYEYVAGYSCYNDGSVRDWQLATSQWTPGKNFPCTGAFGPWLALPDELPADATLEIVTRLNGQEVQRATTDMMIFSIPKLISFISSFTTLEPGDVIVTGTPGGVGMRRDPPLFMKEGDSVEVEVKGVGTLVNTVASG